MTTYAATTDRQRAGLPGRAATWVARQWPCRCAPDWTDRGMHATDCQHAVAVDVLDSALEDGLLRPDDDTVPATLTPCPQAGCLIGHYRGRGDALLIEGTWLHVTLHHP